VNPSPASPGGRHVERLSGVRPTITESTIGVPATQEAPSPILTVDELAALLRLDRKTVYSMVKRGEIPGVRRFGRAVRIHRETVLRWLADGLGSTPRARRRP